ncbi:MAG: YHS domain-containing protein [Mariprofundaceae bacterium]|nr:YHS domain-containing protein [Mariprofundaceae bacterium]
MKHNSPVVRTQHEKKDCPVCGMDTSNTKITTEYLGISYRFCSRQCLENFTTHPKLYLGIKSLKQEGKHVIKRRFFVFEHPIQTSVEDTLEITLSGMMGVRDVQMTSAKVTVTYDLLEVTSVQVEKHIEQAGARLGTGWADRLKRAWIQYTEENELDSLAATNTVCCNKPPTKT